MFTREIVTSVAIAAPPERVGAVLTDFAAYAAWSPFVRFIAGELRAGGRIAVRMSPDGGKEHAFRPVLRAVEPGRELRWLGRLPVPGLFGGEHRFVLAPDGADGMRFEHGERFSGLLVFLMAGISALAREALGRMNAALKARSEAPA